MGSFSFEAMNELMPFFAMRVQPDETPFRAEWLSLYTKEEIEHWTQSLVSIRVLFTCNE
jgi:hypothetical protein